EPCQSTLETALSAHLYSCSSAVARGSEQWLTWIEMSLWSLSLSRLNASCRNQHIHEGKRCSFAGERLLELLVSRLQLAVTDCSRNSHAGSCCNSADGRLAEPAPFRLQSNSTDRRCSSRANSCYSFFDALIVEL